MARQRGPHQLSGKINNLCYYEQKGIRGGLVRRINEAMSERVKSAPEFANTRNANSRFGMCSMYAGQMFSIFPSRLDFLHKYDRQAILTKALKECYDAQHGIDKGKTFVNDTTLVYSINNAFNRLVKNKVTDFFPIKFNGPFVPTSSNEVKVDIIENIVENAAKLLECDGFIFSLSGNIGFYPPQYNSETNKYTAVSPDISNQVNLNYSWKKGDGDVVFGADMNHIDDGINIFYLSIIPFNDREGRGNQQLIGKSMCMVNCVVGV